MQRLVITLLANLAMLVASPCALAELDPPSTYGEWELNAVQAPFSPAHAALLHNGKVLFVAESDFNNTTVWDPVANTFAGPAGLPGTPPIFCGGHAFLPSGKLLLVGGGGGDPGNPSTKHEAWLFDPDSGVAGTWTRTGDMSLGRYYPTVVSLGGGRMLIYGGWTGVGDEDYADDLEVYNEVTGTFTVVTGGRKRFKESYPGMHLLANGKAFFSRTGFGHCGALCDDSGSTAWYFQFDDLANPTSGAWHEVPSSMPYPDRSEGFSVQILTRSGTNYSSRVAVFGGGEPTTTGWDTAVQMDTSVANPATWSWSVLDADMEGQARVHGFAILLPDGGTLVFGGGQHCFESPTPFTNTTSELYPSSGGASSRMDDLAHPRGYHGVALLLPDGRVMTSGGNDFNCETPEPFEKTIELFSPPYLFHGGTRPSIINSPTAANYGQTITVTVSHQQTRPIQKVVLVRPVAMTHVTDTEQRVVDLAFSQYAIVCNPQGSCVAGLNVQAPSGTAPYPHAPAGYYMLFALDSEGVPSVAKFVKLQ